MSSFGSTKKTISPQNPSHPEYRHFGSAPSVDRAFWLQPSFWCPTVTLVSARICASVSGEYVSGSFVPQNCRVSGRRFRSGHCFTPLRDRCGDLRRSAPPVAPQRSLRSVKQSPALHRRPATLQFRFTSLPPPYSPSTPTQIQASTKVTVSHQNAGFSPKCPVTRLRFTKMPVFLKNSRNVQLYNYPKQKRS